MKSYREFDFIGHNLANTQASLFAEASRKGYNSFYFVRRFAYSPYCREFDTTGLRSSSSTNLGYMESIEGSIAKRGNVLPIDVMHWIGYLTRYWCYVENVSLRWIFRQVHLSYLASIYNAYHSLSPQQTIEHIKEALGFEARQQEILQRHKERYLAIVEEELKKYKEGK